MAATVEQRELTMGEVLAGMREHCPDALESAYIVGKWIWAEFAEKPSQAIRDQLKGLGFRWNPGRGVWQNSCGYRSKRSSGDPRYRYGTRKASTAPVTVEQFEDSDGDQWE